MNILDYINELYIVLNNQNNNLVIAAVFVGICLIVIALRIVVCAGYQSNIAYFRLNAKEIKNLKDIKIGGFGLLNKAVSDYVKMADKCSSNIDVKAIVDKHVMRLSILGWSYHGIESFVVGIEQGAVFAGILLAVVFEEYRFIFGLLGITVFILFKLFAAIFDFSLVRAKLVIEVTEYIDREVGQFYGADMSSAVMRLKNSLTDAVMKQTDIMNETMKKLGSDLLSMQETMKEAMKDTMKTPIKEPMREPASHMEIAASKFSEVLNTLDSGLKEHNERISRQTGSIEKQINTLVAVAAEINSTNESVSKNNEAVTQVLNYIEKNQQILEKSVQQYEMSLENITERLGDGFSGIVEFQTRSSFNAMNESLQNNISKIISSNNDMLLRITQLFDSLLEQSRSETKTILQVKEHLDMLRHGRDI